jgi:hypothetical protein
MTPLNKSHVAFSSAGIRSSRSRPTRSLSLFAVALRLQPGQQFELLQEAEDVFSRPFLD